MSARINVDGFQEGLQTKWLGRNIFFSRAVHSTNDWAKELAELGASEGTIAIAETQTAGRGRLGKDWVSPKGGLWFTFILRPRLKPAEAVKLVFVAGLAVAQVLHELHGFKVETKWPNDVLVNGRKICGVLAEMNTTGGNVNFVALGVGVNANFDAKKALPKKLWKDATSLESELGRKIRLEKLFKALLERLEVIYEKFLKEGFNPILEEWKVYAEFLGHQVEVVSQNEKLVGLASDVNQEGALVLKLEDGTLNSVFVGTLSLRRR